MSRLTLLLPALLLASFCAHAADDKPAIKPGWTLLPESTEAKVEQIVLEDDNTRIEELRVRGQTQKVTIKPKDAPSYEIIMGDGSHELSPGAGSTRGAIGKRVWRVLDF